MIDSIEELFENGVYHPVVPLGDITARTACLAIRVQAVENARRKKSPPRIPEAGTLVTELAFAPRRVLTRPPARAA